MTSPQELPRYAELPTDPVTGARSGWGVFGADDNVGKVNLQTPERVAAAARLVRTGQIFPMDIPAGFVDPPFFSRGVPRHTLIERRPTEGFDDVVDNLYPQAGSQWDALAHASSAPDRFYNGVAAAQIRSGQRNTMDHWARRGIAGRGVLLDVASAVQERGGAGTSVPVTVDDLETARARVGLELGAGDILVVRTGYLSWYAQQDKETRARIAPRDALTAAGLEHSEQLAEYVWDSHVSAIITDTVGMEVWPPDRSTTFGSLHRILIGQFGLAIGELFWLDDLATACDADGVHEFLVVSAPMNLAGAIGSPANALAIK